MPFPAAALHARPCRAGGAGRRHGHRRRVRAVAGGVLGDRPRAVQAGARLGAQFGEPLARPAVRGRAWRAAGMFGVDGGVLADARRGKGPAAVAARGQVRAAGQDRVVLAAVDGAGPDAHRSRAPRPTRSRQRPPEIRRSPIAAPDGHRQTR